MVEALLGTPLERINGTAGLSRAVNREVVPDRTTERVVVTAGTGAVDTPRQIPISTAARLLW